MKTRALHLDDDRVRALLRTVNPMTQIRFAVKLPHNNSLGRWEPMALGGPNGGRTAAGETIPEQGGIWHTRTGECFTSEYGQPGDRLRVREAWCHLSDVRTSDPGGDAIQRRAFYRADYPGDTLMHDDDPAEKIKWRSSRVMPRWASRITLEVTGVRVERLRDISETDAKAEGITPSIVGADLDHVKYRAGFQTLWNERNAARGFGWEVNPWVWVIYFERPKTKQPGERS
jgi:hypothetical protein